MVIPPATTASALCGRRTNATQAATAAQPTTAASAIKAVRPMRSKAAATSEAAVTAAVTPNTICAIVTRSTASGYAEEDEGGGQRNHRGAEQAQGAFGLHSDRRERAFLAALRRERASRGLAAPS